MLTSVPDPPLLKAAPPSMSTHPDVSSHPARSPIADRTSSTVLERIQPIPAPSEPQQYRAIGLVRGRYHVGEQLTQGTLIASDGTEIDAVLLGRMMSLMKKHLDLTTEHLWVVYPRTRETSVNLHAQIVGVWEPETLDSTEIETSLIPSGVGDDYFSIRGEVIFHNPQTEQVKVKIKQAARKPGDKPRSFKLNLKGALTGRVLRNFWEFHVLRQGNDLVIQEALWIAPIPRSAKPWSNRRPGSRMDRRGAQRRPGEQERPGRPTPKPVVSGAATSRQAPTAPIIRRRKSTPES
ncbi:hypothetical protein [Roseofilum casamattae]|uniref:Uncharacterized protein n=1 Tax=Roseofilum casamattae BLCC-M143 TaxID=3022442 RepID=A0ABT7C0Z8_9CYAN|nr:hypothetical protein [Roseofilum casamattae]MDJ1185132.1 hypothetical protein [Roseofilum casamattae BLCC-M143]